jgi:hypothetical protein
MIKIFGIHFEPILEFIRINVYKFGHFPFENIFINYAVKSTLLPRFKIIVT